MYRQVVESFAADNGGAVLKRILVSAAQLGEAEQAELRVEVDRTFVPSKLPAARTALTRLANDYHDHRVKIAGPKGVVVWKYDGKKNQLVSQTLTPDQVEEYYGLRYARRALDLDPAYRPAQGVLSRTGRPDIGGAGAAAGFLMAGLGKNRSLGAAPLATLQIAFAVCYCRTADGERP